jgi:hypothetical protein
MANKDFTDFLLTEYENIAKAHFNAYDIGARWWKYYFIILAIPFSLIAFLYKADPSKLDLFNLPVSAALVILFAGIANIFVSYIIVDLKLDSILYARTVNGIRHYFVRQGIKDELIAENNSEYLVLPTSVNKPPFWSLNSDLFMQTLFLSSANALYCCAGFIQIVDMKFYFPNCAIWFLFLITIFGQYFLYWRASRKKENSYFISETK